MRFLCDAMLGKLCRWLRIFGYDCLLAPERATDEEVIAMAEDRILLTRDKKLAELPDSLYVPYNDLRPQLKLLIETYKLKLEINPNHCSICNAKLEPSNTLGGEGWRCTGCGQEYWRGSHWDKINEFARSITST